MSARLLKKVLREQEQEQLQQPQYHPQHIDSDQDEEEAQKVNGKNSGAPSSINPFDLLNDDDHDADQVPIPLLLFLFSFPLSFCIVLPIIVACFAASIEGFLFFLSIPLFSDKIYCQMVTVLF